MMNYWPTNKSVVNITTNDWEACLCWKSSLVCGKSHQHPMHFVKVQWSLSIMVTVGPSFFGLSRKVAALDRWITVDFRWFFYTDDC